MRVNNKYCMCECAIKAKSFSQKSLSFSLFCSQNQNEKRRSFGGFGRLNVTSAAIADTFFAFSSPFLVEIWLPSEYILLSTILKMILKYNAHIWRRRRKKVKKSEKTIWNFYTFYCYYTFCFFLRISFHPCIPGCCFHFVLRV